MLSQAILVDTTIYLAQEDFKNPPALARGVCQNDGFSSSDMTLIIQLTVGKDVIFDEGFEVKYHVPDKDVECPEILKSASSAIQTPNTRHLYT